MYPATVLSNWSTTNLPPLVKRSSGSSKRAGALVRIGHRSTESNTKRQPELPHPITVTRNCNTLTDSEETRVTGKEKWDQRRCRHKATVCFRSYNTERRQTRNLTSGASQSHSQHSPPKHNNTTTSSVQHIRERGTKRDRGNRCFQPTDNSFLKCHRITMWLVKIPSYPEAQTHKWVVSHSY